MGRIVRFSVGVASLGALAFALLVGGWGAYVAGMMVFLALPLTLDLAPGRRVEVGAATRYFTAPNGLAQRDRALRAAALVTTVMSIWAPFMVVVGIVSIPFLLYGAAIRALCPARLLHAITLERDDLTIMGPAGPKVVRYEDIQTVSSTPGAIAIETWIERCVVGCPFAPELAEAIELARTQAREEAGRPRLGPLELRRGFGMTARAWLDRLDGLVAAARSPGAYRGGGGGKLDDDELWRVLHDGREEPATRAAAARALSASSDELTRRRVAEAGRAITDPALRTRIEICTQQRDAARAAFDYEQLEREEMQKQTRG